MVERRVKKVRVEMMFFNWLMGMAEFNEFLMKLDYSRMIIVEVYTLSSFTLKITFPWIGRVGH